MNIGIFTDTYFPQINGVATSTQILKGELEKRGHTVYIFTTTDPKAAPEKAVFRLPSMPLVFLPTHRMTLAYPPTLLLRMTKLKLDVVHTQTEFPLGVLGKLISKFLGAPLVHTYHTMYEDYVHYIAGGALITPPMARQYSRVFCNSARVVIAPTEKARESLLDYGVERPVRVIPTGINFAPFARSAGSAEETAALKAELGVPADCPVIVTVGRVAKEKSVDVIVKGFAELLKDMPETRLIIVGGGPMLDDLKDMAAELGIGGSMVFTGFRPWSEVGRYYRLGDVFVSASTSETQGLTYLEAMAAGTPVVAKRDPSVEGLIRDRETGFFFEGDGELAGVLRAALTDGRKRREIAANADKAICPLSSEVFGENVVRLYEEVSRAYPRKRHNLRKLNLSAGRPAGE